MSRVAEAGSAALGPAGLGHFPSPGRDLWGLALQVGRLPGSG